MEPVSAKRRKLDHSIEEPQGALVAAASTGLSKSMTFILEADELLEEVKLDYGAALEGVDGFLHKIKGSIEAIKPQESSKVKCAC